MSFLQLKRILTPLWFFLSGAILASLAVAVCFVFVFYQYYRQGIYPNIVVAGVDVSGLTPPQARQEIEKKFYLPNYRWQFSYQDRRLEFNQESLGLALATEKMVQSAYSIGRSSNPYKSFWQIWRAYWRGTNLPLELAWNPDKKTRAAAVVRPFTDYPPIDAQFKFQPGAGPDGKGRVVAFIQSKEGQELDQVLFEKMVLDQTLSRLLSRDSSPVNLEIPTRPVPPAVSSDRAANLGINERVGVGESYFYDSIAQRVYNIGLGTQKISGSLIGPGETFSFNQAIGTVSALFGFQKAYAIVKGKTVLDDGGGVCQVSTTLYRAALKAGLPITERAGHSYRVGFYEQGGFLPGLDATVYPPSPDFKFKNDTGNWILIQANFDKSISKLTFDLFGTSDGRVSTVSGPVILSTSPPPDPVYEDDPTLPAGTIKQVDTAHPGAMVYFTRRVKRGDEILIDERVDTNYIPWPARYLRGTRL